MRVLRLDVIQIYLWFFWVQIRWLRLIFWNKRSQRLALLDLLFLQSIFLFSGCQHLVNIFVLLVWRIPEVLVLFQCLFLWRKLFSLRTCGLILSGWSHWRSWLGLSVDVGVLSWWLLGSFFLLKRRLSGLIKSAYWSQVPRTLILSLFVGATSIRSHNFVFDCEN